MSQPPLNNIAILGSGICGLAAALSITFLPHPIPFTLYELRPVLSSIGGAVGLTPNALRYLDRLGVLSKLNGKKLGCETDGVEIFSIHSGRNMGEISFRGMADGYKGRRVMRKDLLEGMLETLQERMRDSGVGQVIYGKKAVALTEKGTQVEITFEDGTTAMGDMVLGCDGIHSVTRTAFVEPERTPEYSGIAAAYGIASAENLTLPLHFDTSGVNSSRQGSLLTSFCDADRKKMYVAAVMETEEQFSREGWKAKGEDQEHVRKDIMNRFEGGVFPVVEELIEKTEDWFLYPVYKLSPKGRWCKGRVMLLGDAAHAVSSTPLDHFRTRTDTVEDATAGRISRPSPRRRRPLHADLRPLQRRIHRQNFRNIRDTEEEQDRSGVCGGELSMGDGERCGVVGELVERIHHALVYVVDKRQEGRGIQV
jgi:salicylate hydroxylase